MILKCLKKENSFPCQKGKQQFLMCIKEYERVMLLKNIAFLHRYQHFKKIMLYNWNTITESCFWFKEENNKAGSVYSHRYSHVPMVSRHFEHSCDWSSNKREGCAVCKHIQCCLFSMQTNLAFFFSTRNEIEKCHILKMLTFKETSVY